MSSIKIILPLAVLTLGLHTYWWKNWIKKYLKKKTPINKIKNQ
jgi:hypothetical protein